MTYLNQEVTNILLIKNTLNSHVKRIKETTRHPGYFKSSSVPWGRGERGRRKGGNGQETIDGNRMKRERGTDPNDFLLHNLTNVTVS